MSSDSVGHSDKDAHILFSSSIGFSKKSFYELMFLFCSNETFFISLEFEDDLLETNSPDVTDGKLKRQKNRTKVITLLNESIF